MSQQELRLTMLGKFELGWGDGRFQKVFTPEVSLKNRALLCYLILNNRRHQREELCRIFWPDKSMRRAKSNLRVALTALRNVGLGPYLDTQKPEILFVQTAHYWCDVQTFQALISKSRHQGTPDTHALRKAVALYGGEFLAGFSQQDLPVFDEWVHTQNQRLLDLMLDGLDELIRESMKDSAAYESGIQYAKRALELVPWREETHRNLMWLLASSGHRDAALAQYELCREVLKTALDIDEPAAQTVELVVNIRQLRSLSKPHTRPLPPLQQPRADNQTPFLAPRLGTIFLGRSVPLARLEAALTAVSNLPPCLGIVGMGGIGKTTLALQLAHTLRNRFPDGVLWANVVAEQPEEIATQWAAAYGFDLSQQNSGEERLAAVRRLLAEKQALLILDDVWAGAKIRDLLPDTGRCAVLITSRLERIVRDVGSELVPLAQFSLESSRRLLLHHVDEARANADPEAVDEICQLVGNLPLALSIAGSYLAYRPHRSLASFVIQLKQQIAPLDLSEDTQRIRETFELSWTHLDETPRRLFALSGLFGGRSFGLEAIAAIVQMNIYQVEDRLQDLVKLSLLNDLGGKRYRQHALLATFAQDKLEDAVAPKQRYVAYFADFAQRHVALYEKLRPEWGNIDTAVQFAESTQQWEAVLQFTAVLKAAWFARGRFQQARDAFKIAFHAAVRLEDERQLASNWLWWGQACLEQGDQDEARKWLQQALDLYDELEDGIGIADAEYELARLDIEQTLNEEAEQRLNRVLMLRQEQADVQGTAAALSRFARLRHRQQDNEAAQAFALEAVDRQQAIGDVLGHCKTLRLLVFIMIGLKQHQVACLYAEESLALAHRLDDLGEIAMAKKGLAAVCRVLGRLEEANALAAASYTALEKMGDRQSMTAVRFLQCLIKRSEGNYGEAMLLVKECLSEFASFKDELHVAYCLTHQGDFYQFSGDKQTAVQKWQAALQLAQKLDNAELAGKINGRLHPAKPTG